MKFQAAITMSVVFVPHSTVEAGQFASNLVDQQVLYGSAASWPTSAEHDSVSTTKTGATDPTVLGPQQLRRFQMSRASVQLI